MKVTRSYFSTELVGLNVPRPTSLSDLSVSAEGSSNSGMTHTTLNCAEDEINYVLEHVIDYYPYDERAISDAGGRKVQWTFQGENR